MHFKATFNPTCMDKPGMDLCRSKLDLHTSNLDLHRSRLDLCRSKEKRQIWDFGYFATGKNSSFCVQQRLWNSFFKILSFRGCHFAKNCMKIVNFTLLLGPTWVQRWTYIGPDWTHVGPAWTYIDPSQVYPYWQNTDINIYLFGTNMCNHTEMTISIFHWFFTFDIRCFWTIFN